jgi:hypothetical protein
MTANYFLVKPAAAYWRWAAFGLFLMLCVLGLSHRTWAADQASACETCHVGIESMHADIPMACVDCHGGNDKATSKDQAHVQPNKRSCLEPGRSIPGADLTSSLPSLSVS